MLAALLSLSACAPEGVAGDPISRRLTWFSMLGGDDIRDECAPGAPPRYRFVYNAVYTEQVRVYELFVRHDDGAALDTVVLPGGATIGSSTLADIGALIGGRRSRVELAPEETRALLAAIAASGVHAPPPVGLRLRSDSFYWTVAACYGGRFHFTAFVHPSPGFAALRFPEFLFAHDRAGVPINPPRPLDLGPFEQTGTHETGPGRNTGPRFLIQVGRNGLVR